MPEIKHDLGFYKGRFFVCVSTGALTRDEIQNVIDKKYHKFCDEADMVMSNSAAITPVGEAPKRRYTKRTKRDNLGKKPLSDIEMKFYNYMLENYRMSGQDMARVFGVHATTISLWRKMLLRKGYWKPEWKKYKTLGAHRSPR